MIENNNRRRFLQTSLAAGAGFTLGGASSSFGEGRAARAPAQDANPRVRPGRVRWHDDFNDACTASRISGKPVFHFQMLGRLDERFC